MGRSRKACRALVAVALTGTVVVVALPPPAGSQVVAIVTLEGQAVVGSTLTATLMPNDPGAVVEYRWHRCVSASPPHCARIAEAASAPSYTVTEADVGNGLAVQVFYVVAGVQMATWSLVTDVVTAAPAPVPSSTPTPMPNPLPERRDADVPEEFDRSRPGSPPAAVAPAPSPAVLRQLPLLRPFPVVRVKGTLLRGGALISLLRVRAPATATVDVRCTRRRCRLRHRSFGSGRISRLERFLRAGTRITIRVSSPNAVGKYVRLVIRDGAAPRRRDACVMPGSGKPVECPPA
jgi:hypothetical protein